MSNFTHLHVHTEYSLLDGMNRIPKLMEKTKELKMDAVAMTDHGVMNGAAEFWMMAKDFSLKPIMGCEIYLAPKERSLRKDVNGIKYYHLLLLAKNKIGYENLMKISSIGHLEGMYYKPRADVETLKKHSEGIICTSACLAGPVPRHIVRDEFEKAEEWLQTLHSIYGENFYLEVQRNGFAGHDEIEDAELRNFDADAQDMITKQIKVNKKLREYSDKYKIPLVATTDAHYLDEDDKDIQKILFCVKDGITIDNPKAREGYLGTYIVEPATMEKKFADDKSPLENTMKIAEQIEEFDITFDRVQPVFWNLPKERTAEEELYLQTLQGAVRQYTDLVVKDSPDDPVGDAHVRPLRKSEDKFDSVKTNSEQPEEANTSPLSEKGWTEGRLDVDDNKTTPVGTNHGLSLRDGQNKLTEEQLQSLTIDQLKELLDNELIERIDYELKVIHDKGYDDYFLVVSDILKWSARNGILTGVRGSVAGSVVGHCLDIVAVDPIKWELYFERFLNPERPSPPDIDMDIQDSRRDELIEYVKEKYGEQAIAAICAIGRMKTKAAIRDIARATNIDLAIADKLSKMVTVLFGKPFTFEKMMETDAEFKRIVEADPKLLELGERVKKVEGQARHMSVHACGYLITPGAIKNYSPLQKESGSGDRTITQLEGPWIEEIGLMKFDFLGLRTLTIISNAIKNIKYNHGVEIDFWNIPDDDEATFELFASGETMGVFQFESPPMRQYLQQLEPSTQEDICFMVAAYRPGPMKYIPDYIDIKHGRQEPTFLIPELKPILEKTNGFAIYQEQVIKIAVELGGYTMGGADLLRRAMGKKKMKIMKQEEPIFKKGIMDKGYSQTIADKIWEYLLPFADYGFNKAHAAGYAVLAYKCAYLKAHYPLEFMTALMESDLNDTDRIVIDMKEAKRMGYEILPPNINKSFVKFSAEDEKGIRFGIGAIKNVGLKICKNIINERKENGDFANLDDLVQRVEPGNISKKACECLIQAGAMDEFGDRNALLEVLPQVFQKASRDKQAKEMGQTSLFAMGGEEDSNATVEATPFPSTVEEATDRQKLDWEKDLLGLFITTHPLKKFRWAPLLSGFRFANDMDNLNPGSDIRMVAMFGQVKEVQTKKDGKRMAIVQIEDASGRIDGVIFPRTYDKYLETGIIEENKPLLISGKVNEREDKKSVIVNEIEPAASIQKPKSLQIDISRVSDEEKLNEIKTCIDDSGDVDVTIFYGNPKEKKSLVKKMKLSNEENIEVLSEFVV